jgi:hypothetical protein
MQVHFYINRATGEPHVEDHGVEAWEAIDVLKNADMDYNGRNGTRVAVGQTQNGRFLRVIYRRLEGDDSRLVITAYDLPPKAKIALRRFRRRK